MNLRELRDSLNALGAELDFYPVHVGDDWQVYEVVKRDRPVAIELLLEAIPNHEPEQVL